MILAFNILLMQSRGRVDLPFLVGGNKLVIKNGMGQIASILELICSFLTKNDLF